MTVSRRELFRIIGAATIATRLPACGDNRTSHVLDNDEADLLEAFADVILPPDDEPGGAALGVLAYTDRLLTAFDNSIAIPIFASGPFSDRNPVTDPVPNDFAHFVELDRVTEAVWRLRVGELRDQLRAGLRAALAIANDQLSSQELFDAQPDDFKELVFDLVTEAAWAAPEYGGNPNGAGWKMVHFEGDSLPLGFTQVTADGRFLERADAPHSSANPGPDPAPLDAEVEDTLSTAIRALGGVDNS